MRKTARKTSDETTEMADPHAHDAWARDQIELALKAKREDKSKYKSLQDVAAKFGFDAR